MRSLNKIIFINSANKSIKYAEVNLDGNVHLIGTQGVGKSTLLRAILFFYNADKIKLGIDKGKRTFDEYYFPYQNSYIVYEVKTETGLFCVLAFKSQGRVALRFFDAAFDKNFFIDKEGKAHESWDKTREAFGKNIFYTKIIHSYEEYRNILYGNNKGLTNEFRKYALLESKQYQNIPRTITNVFLNANLSAEFVKETIIKSLNEEDIKIDLTNYSHNHLRDFESNLSDIKKWTDRNKSGENAVEKQAGHVSRFYSALKHLDKKKIELALQLGWALNNLKELQPRAKEKLAIEELKRKKLSEKLRDLDGVFDKKKEKAIEQIGKFKGKLNEIKERRGQYEVLKIDLILEKVSKRNSLEIDKRNLLVEQAILSSKFLEITQRYDALLNQLANQLKEYKNSKQFDKINAQEALFLFKEKVSKEYELLFEEIRKQNKRQLEIANGLVKEKADAITNLRIKRSEIINKHLYETEIEGFKSEILALTNSVADAENEVRRANEKIKNIQKEWELEEIGVKATNDRLLERQNDIQSSLLGIVASIEAKLENTKDSLYGWLNEHVPDWAMSIGKVIDEENVLFKSGLNPRIVGKLDLSFFGIGINTEEISKSVKTVADYEKEKEELKDKIQSGLQAIATLNVKQAEDSEKLKRKFQPKVKEQKEVIQNNEYALGQNKIRLQEKDVRLAELKSKIEVEKKDALANNEDETARYSEEELKAKDEVIKIEAGINKLIDGKRKEKESKFKVEQQKFSEIQARIELEIQQNKIELARKELNIKALQNRELDKKGADTKKLSEIDIRLIEINTELVFINTNRDTVAEYYKDKRELFDKEDEFKNQKLSFERQLDADLNKHKQQQKKFYQEMGELKAEIESINRKLGLFETDISAYESFLKTDTYESFDIDISTFDEKHKTDLLCVKIIEELNQTYYALKDRNTDLQEAVNRFTGNFQESNIFSFKTKFTDRKEYVEFAELLKEFIDENKIDEYKKRVEERFAHIIRQIGKETGDLVSKEGEIHEVISDINKDFVARKFVQAIKSMELRTVASANRIFQLLVEIKKFNDENSFTLGVPNLFAQEGQSGKNEKAISLLKQLIKEMLVSKEKELTLSDSFELQFRIVENDNDTDWVEKLSNVGSDGTDILVKAMINIMLLNVFKERAAKKNKDDFRLHCMMDEIGKLHPNNVKGILKFANDRNIYLINSSPTSYNAADYRYTYLLAKDDKNVTSIKRLVRKIPNLESENTAQAT
ncbi:MAG: ATP-binding protein [bacterium]|nr:ATP-binding protein [bacterium]